MTACEPAAAVRSRSDPALRRRLIDRVVDPLLERYGRHPAITAWDVLNEPEWVTQGRASALPPVRACPRGHAGIHPRRSSSLVHHRTSHAATVGSASTRTLPLVEGLGLDVYQAHWYDRLEKKAPLDRPVAELGLDRPLILGEFPTRGSRRSPAEIRRDRPPGRLRRRARLVGAGRRRGVGRERAGGGAV